MSSDLKSSLHLINIIGNQKEDKFKNW